MSTVRSGKRYVSSVDLEKELLDSVGFSQMPVAKCPIYFQKQLYSKVTICTNECYTPCSRFMSGKIYEDNSDWYEDDAGFYAKLKELIIISKKLQILQITKTHNKERLGLICTVSRASQKLKSKASEKIWISKRHTLRARKEKRREHLALRVAKTYEEYIFLIKPKPGNTRYANFNFRKREYARKYRNIL